ncbi:hypothetical protein MMC27_002931 [Xylographa pallens]|nr:hypothetical protein [Xylographa pallens]
MALQISSEDFSGTATFWLRKAVTENSALLHVLQQLMTPGISEHCVRSTLLEQEDDSIRYFVDASVGLWMLASVQEWVKEAINDTALESWKHDCAFQQRLLFTKLEHSKNLSKDATELGPESSRNGKIPNSTSATKSANIERRLTNLSVWLSAAFPILTFVVWICIITKKGVAIQLLSNSRIGGRFTLVEAKAIDFVCGGILAPVVMSAIDFCWFFSSRIAVIGEQHSTARLVPLKTLVDMGSLSSGTYNPYRIASLLQSKQPPLLAMAALTLLSAIAYTSLTNMVAYEAYTATIEGSSNLLNRLSNSSGNFNSTMSQQITWYDVYFPRFDAGEKAEFSEQFVDLLTGISYGDSIHNLLNGTIYLGINVTNNSLSAVSEDIVELYNIPAYQLRAKCGGAALSNFSIGNTYSAPLYLTTNNSTQSPVLVDLEIDNVKFTGTMADSIQDLESFFESYSTTVSWSAFSIDLTQVFIAMITVGNLSGITIPTDFGDMAVQVFNLSSLSFVFTGNTSIVSIWGMKCSVTRQDGFVDLTRSVDSIWESSLQNFSGTPYIQRLAISQFQLADLYTEPYSITSGFTPALFGDDCAFDNVTCNLLLPASMNSTILAANLLYAEGKLEQIMYNTGAPSNLTTNHPQFTVSSAKSQQAYAITYVPAILIIALFSIMLAGLITSWMAFSSRKTFATRAFRNIDPLRLVMDSVAGFKDDKVFPQAQGWTRKNLEKWAGTYRVGYRLTSDGDGLGVLALQREKVD